MRKIEGDNVTTVETVQHIKELENTLEQRREDDFLSPKTAAAKKSLVDDGYIDAEITAVCNEFYSKYIKLYSTYAYLY